MALIRYVQSLSLPDGSLASRLPATVLPLGGNVRVPLFADKAGQQTLSNPTSTDEFGQVAFYAEAGQYVSDLGGTQFVYQVDPAETDEAWPAKPVPSDTQPT